MGKNHPAFVGFIKDRFSEDFRQECELQKLLRPGKPYRVQAAAQLKRAFLQGSREEVAQVTARAATQHCVARARMQGLTLEQISEKSGVLPKNIGGMLRRAGGKVLTAQEAAAKGTAARWKISQPDLWRKQDDALAMREGGAQWAAIAKALGFASASGACEAAKAAKKRSPCYAADGEKKERYPDAQYAHAAAVMTGTKEYLCGSCGQYHTTSDKGAPDFISAAKPQAPTLRDLVEAIDPHAWALVEIWNIVGGGIPPAGLIPVVEELQKKVGITVATPFSFTLTHTQR